MYILYLLFIHGWGAGWGKMFCKFPILISVVQLFFLYQQNEISGTVFWPGFYAPYSIGTSWYLKKVD